MGSSIAVETPENIGYIIKAEKVKLVGNSLYVFLFIAFVSFERNIQSMLLHKSTPAEPMVAYSGMEPSIVFILTLIVFIRL
jgi:hypothetical protein